MNKCVAFLSMLIYLACISPANAITMYRGWAGCPAGGYWYGNWTTDRILANNQSTELADAARLVCGVNNVTQGVEVQEW